MTREVIVRIPNVQAGALTHALKLALADLALGVSAHEDRDDVSIWLADAAAEADLDTARSVAESYDPGWTPPPDPLAVDLDTARTEAGANPLDGITLSQAMTYIDTNVDSLATAKEVLKLAVKIVAVQERRIRIIEKALGLNGS